MRASANQRGDTVRMRLIVTLSGLVYSTLPSTADRSLLPGAAVGLSQPRRDPLHDGNSLSLRLTTPPAAEAIVSDDGRLNDRGDKATTLDVRFSDRPMTLS